MAWNQHLDPAGSKNVPPPPTWWRDGSPGCKIAGSTVSKVKDNPEFTVVIGTTEFSMGCHEWDFTVDKHRDSYMYFGVARPSIERDQTFCRRGAESWYYFGTGHTCALRHGYEDIVSKETGTKLPKLGHGERVRCHLDMNEGTLSFSLVSQDMATTKKIPGIISGIIAPVCAAVCIQNRNDSVTLVDNPHAPRTRAGLQSAGRNRRGVADGHQQQQQQQQHQQVAEGPKLDPAERDAARRRLFGLSSEQFEGRLAMIERRRRRGGDPGGPAGSTGPGHVRGSLDSASAAAAPHPATRTRPLSGSLCDLRKNHFSDFDAAVGVGAAPAAVASSPRPLVMQDRVIYHGGGVSYTGGVGGGYRPDVVTTPPRSWHRVLSSDPSSSSPRLSPHVGARRVGHTPPASRGVDEDEQLINSYMGISNLRTGDDWTPAPAALSSPLTVVGLQREGGGGGGGIAGSGGAREFGVGPWKFGRDAGQSPPGKKLTFERSGEGKHSVLEGRGIVRRGQGGERRSEPLVIDGASPNLHLGGIAQSSGAPVGGGENLYQKVVMSRILALSQQSRGGGGGRQQKGVSPKSEDKAGARARPSMSGSPNSRQAKKFFGGASRGPG